MNTSNNFLIKNSDGTYEANGPLPPKVIMRTASQILLESLVGKERLSSAADAAEFLRMELAHEENEHFGVLFLTQRHQVIAYERLFSGTINAAAIYPRVVVKKALEHNAAALILAHNHPSGDAAPSPADKEITKRLQDALELVEIRVLDHFIVTADQHQSMAESGLM
ncbi:MAG TPA: DNA repair protein RadC [Alcanivoracaceae bacterium]|nr:DNA repair protein RadC [Alcanivoracaceae bacterium]